MNAGVVALLAEPFKRPWGVIPFLAAIPAPLQQCGLLQSHLARCLRGGARLVGPKDRTEAASSMTPSQQGANGRPRPFVSGGPKFSDA
jgi:hypothetical protein